MQVIPPDVVEPAVHGVDFAGHDAFHRNMDHVVDEDPENQERAAERHDRVIVGPIALDRQAGQGKPEEHGPAVTQKDVPGLLHPEVIGKEPQPRADDGHRQPAEACLLGLKCHHAHEEGQQNSQPRRQPVHPVEEVKRVGDPHDPEQCDQHVGGFPDRSGRKEREHFAGIDDQPGRAHLRGQLIPGPELPGIIHDADHQEQ